MTYKLATQKFINDKKENVLKPTQGQFLSVNNEWEALQPLSEVLTSTIVDVVARLLQAQNFIKCKLGHER